MSGWIDYFQASFSILSSDSSSSRSSSRRTSRSTQVEPTISFNYSNSCNNEVSIDKSGDDSGSDKYNNRYTFDANILDNYDIIYSTFNSSECIQSLLNDVIYDLFLTNNNKESNLLNDGYNNNNTCNNGDIYFTVAGKNDYNDDNYDDSRKNSYGSSSNIHSKTSPYIAAPAIANTDLYHHHQHNHHDGGLLCKHTWSTYSIKRKLVSLIKLLVSQLCVPPIMAIYGIGWQLG